MSRQLQRRNRKVGTRVKIIQVNIVIQGDRWFILSSGFKVSLQTFHQWSHRLKGGLNFSGQKVISEIFADYPMEAADAGIRKVLVSKVKLFFRYFSHSNSHAFFSQPLLWSTNTTSTNYHGGTETAKNLLVAILTFMPHVNRLMTIWVTRWYIHRWKQKGIPHNRSLRTEMRRFPLWLRCPPNSLTLTEKLIRRLREAGQDSPQ